MIKLIQRSTVMVMTLVLLIAGGCTDSKNAHRLEALERSLTDLRKHNNEQEKEIERLHAYVLQLEEENASLKDRIGANSGSYTDDVEDEIKSRYQFVDEEAHEWILSINTDKTARLYEDGTDNIYYGSWDDGLYQGGNMVGNIHVSFSSSNPPIIFRNKTLNYSMLILDGYLYNGWEACEARDPSQRLRISRIQ